MKDPARQQQENAAKNSAKQQENVAVARGFALEGRGLTAGYGTEMVFTDLDIGLPAGSITSIIGPNGCGKSTLLKALSRLLPLRAGSVLLEGEEITRMSSIQVAKKLAILPQAPVVAAGLTVEELVAYGRYPHQRGLGRLSTHDREAIAWALESTGISAFAQRGVDTLSGGQRQRAWIAMALAQETQIILLDEPTTFLDLAHQLEVLQLLQRLNSQTGRTIVMVIHELNIAARVSDCLIALNRGSIIAQGYPAEVMTPEVLREVFAIDAVVMPSPTTGRPVCVTYETLQRGTAATSATPADPQC